MSRALLLRRRALPRGLRWLPLAAFAACAVPRATPEDPISVVVHAEAGAHPELGERLASWTRADLASIAEALGQPQPNQAIAIECGWPEVEGGTLALGTGENARHVRRPGAPCRVLLSLAPEPALRASLRHELVHHVLEGASYPEWLNEGLAEHVAYSLADNPSREDLHQLFHAGLVLAGWGRPLRVHDQNGDPQQLTPQLWVPDLPGVLRMDHHDYERLVLGASSEQDPEFHAVSHLLVMLLEQRAGRSAHARYAQQVAAGADAWEAFLAITGLGDREQTLDALVQALGEHLRAAPQGDSAAREFVRCPCLWNKLPEAWGRLRSVQAYPGGPELSFRRGSGGGGWPSH